MNSEEENIQELAAWNEWKRICCVDGCPTLCYKEILQHRIGRAFMRKINAVANGQGVYLDDKKCADEFDAGIQECAECPGMNKHTGKPRKKKRHKDVVWQIIEESEDPPLKIILGKLLGKKSIINDIVENYLQRYEGFEWETKLITTESSDPPKKISVLVRPDSTNKPVGKDDSSQLEEFLEEPRSENDVQPSSEEMQDFWESLRFTQTEAAIYLIADSDAKISLADPVLLDFLNLQKSQVYDLKDSLLMRLGIQLRQNFDPEQYTFVLKELKNCCEKMLQTEESAREFLKRVAMKNF